MHNPIIYKKIGINIISPTTSVCDHSSFPKEENRDRIDFLVTPIRDGIDFLAPTLVLLTPLHEFSQRHLTEWNKK